jgi:hypothetical protein
MGGGRDIDGDREEGADDPSPVLGMTGNRLLNLRLGGRGIGLGVSKDPSLRGRNLVPFVHPKEGNVP